MNFPSSSGMTEGQIQYAAIVDGGASEDEGEILVAWEIKDDEWRRVYPEEETDERQDS